MIRQMVKYGPHRCWVPHKNGSNILLTWEHTLELWQELGGWNVTDQDQEWYDDKPSGSWASILGFLAATAALAVTVWLLVLAAWA